jgi:hypothetical protein
MLWCVVECESVIPCEAVLGCVDRRAVLLAVVFFEKIKWFSGNEIYGYEILCAYSNDYDVNCSLGCGAMYSGRCLHILQTNLLPSSPQ